MTLILLGFPCSGKTSVGKCVAERLGLPFIDTDREVEKTFFQESGEPLSCYAITEKHGLTYFRDQEKKSILQLTASPASIIALGGGTVLREANADHLRKIGHIVYLQAPFEELVRRNLLRMPLPTYLDAADPYGSCQKLYGVRIPYYEKYAHTTIDTTGLSVEQVAGAIIQLAEVLDGK